MTIDHYLSKIKNEDFKSMIFTEGNKPLVFFFDVEAQSLSEVTLKREEVESLLVDLVPDWKNRKATKFQSYKNGQSFTVEVLNLEDHLSVEILKESFNLHSSNDFVLPAYLDDWSEAEEGVVVFYGSDEYLVNQVRLSYCKKRAESIEGKSLIFRSSDLKFVGQAGHSLSFSKKEDQFLLENKGTVNFNTYSFESSFSNKSCLNVMKLYNQGSVVTLNSSWRDLSMVWSELNSWVAESSVPTEQLSNSILGFVGVRSVTSKKTVVPVFEVFPFDEKTSLSFESKNQSLKIKEELNKKGRLSFNKSLHSLILKREIELSEAYKVSPHPEELNRMLENSGV